MNLISFIVTDSYCTDCVGCALRLLGRWRERRNAEAHRCIDHILQKRACAWTKDTFLEIL